MLGGGEEHFKGILFFFFFFSYHIIFKCIPAPLQFFFFLFSLPRIFKHPFGNLLERQQSGWPGNALLLLFTPFLFQISTGREQKKITKRGGEEGEGRGRGRREGKRGGRGEGSTLSSSSSIFWKRVNSSSLRASAVLSCSLVVTTSSSSFGL